jgi:hypothetical protein
MAFWNPPKGQSVLEIIIALAIVVMTGSAAFGVFGAVLSEHRQVADRATADRLTREGFAAIRNIRDRDWNELAIGTHGLTTSSERWVFAGESDITDGRFTRTVDIINPNGSGCVGGGNELDAQVRVTWAAGAGRTGEVSATSRLTHWRDLTVWGEWTSPTVVGAVDIDAQGEGSGVAAWNDFVAITADVSAASKPSLYVADVSDPTDPFLEGDFTTSDGLFDAIALPEDDLVLTAGPLNNQEMSVFSVSNPSAPAWLANLDLNADANRLFLTGNTLYVAADNGLHVIDVSVPTAPTEIGSVNFGAEAHDVAIRDGIAYVASADNAEEVVIMDVADPANPIMVGSYNIAGNGDALSVEVVGSSLYVGTVENPSSGTELYVFDLTNPQEPILIDSTDVEGDVNDMHAEGAYLFLASGASNHEFMVFCVANPSMLTIEGTLNISQVATDLSFVNNTAYVSMRSNDALQIIQP